MNNNVERIGKVLGIFCREYDPVCKGCPFLKLYGSGCECSLEITDEDGVPYLPYEPEYPTVLMDGDATSIIKLDPKNEDTRNFDDGEKWSKETIG